MWYNYRFDGKIGWMSYRDDCLLYGGCIVKKGVKYIVNNWFLVFENDLVYFLSEYFEDLYEDLN